MYKHADDKLYTLNLEKKMLNSFKKKIHTITENRNNNIHNTLGIRL